MRDLYYEIPQLFNCNYWKTNRTLEHVFREEMAFSLIYNNIHPQKIQNALKTVGLEKLPNYFFLAQVDDYINKSHKYQITQEYNLKAGIVTILNECLATKKIQGFAANLTGLETVACFLCIDHDKDKVQEFADYCKEQVHDRSPYTISVCISSKVSKRTQYAGEYLKMEQALRLSFYTGREQSLSQEGFNTKSGDNKRRNMNLENSYLQICASIGQKKGSEKLAVICDKIIENLKFFNAHPQESRLAAVKLVHRLEEHCQQYNFRKSGLLEKTKETSQLLMGCSFAEDFRNPLWEYFHYIATQIQMGTNDPQMRFQIPVEEFIKSHYAEDISLSDIADIFSFSESYFDRIFKKTFGSAFHCYLRSFRLQISQQLLLTTALSVDQVAEQSGFHTSSYYCTCFKHQYHMTPKEYRIQGTTDLS